ncbi:DUF397 domain-containing protein, partial [Streptomyces cellulosae]
ATTPATVLVRDSKTPHGPRLTLTPTAWAGSAPPRSCGAAGQLLLLSSQKRNTVDASRQYSSP